MNILITGGSGFVGENLLNALYGHSVFCLGRTKPKNLLKGFHFLFLKDYEKNYKRAVTNVDCIIHASARVHVMNDSSTDPLEEFRVVNTYDVLNLAKQAVTSGVKRFIYISSIKVNGEATLLGSPFKSSGQRLPEDFYGQSKSEAEEQLLKLAGNTGLEVVIIRPTLVYGPGVKANFASLMNLVSRGIPLPFGCITQNKRSLVSVVNLVDLIITCIDHPKAANQVFLVSDDHDVSTSEMVREMAKALGKPAWQLPIPIWCYKLVGKLFNKSDVVDRLTGSLQVDISHTKETLGWKPPQTLQEGFKQTAQAFLQAKTK